VEAFRSIQLASTLAQVAKRGRQVIDDVYPEELGAELATPVADPHPSAAGHEVAWPVTLPCCRWSMYHGSPEVPKRPAR
jgi:hypothetical protein